MALKGSPIRDLRAACNLNQDEFWGRVGVTQSAGSRYESGRAIPKPTKLLLDLVYGPDPLELLTALRKTSYTGLLSKRIFIKKNLRPLSDKN